MSQPEPASKGVRWLLLLALLTGSAALLFGLPQPYSGALLLLMVIGALALLSVRAVGGDSRIMRELRAVRRGLVTLFSPPFWIIRAFWRVSYEDWQASLSAFPAAPPARMPPLVSWALALGLVIGALLAALGFNESAEAGLFITLLTAGVGGVGWLLGADVFKAPRLVWRLLRANWSQDDPTLAAPSQRQIALELLPIFILALTATVRYWTASPGIQFSGGEAEWITNSVQWAHIGLRDYGRIPLWQPLLEMGEPLLDNPVGFVLNPFSSVPALLLGPEGLKYSVVIAALLAGVGGWFMGWALGLAWPGRVLLGLLLVGKGNMHAMFNTGYFQLAAQQAYFGWVVGGGLAVIRLPERRWPLVLLALAVTLIWFAGNVWYILPMLLALAGLALTYASRAALRRLLLAGALTIGLSAVTLLPLAVNWGQLGKHPPEIKAGLEVPLWAFVVPFYVNPDPLQPFPITDPNKGVPGAYYMDMMEHFYYSYVLPAGFAVLIVVLLPIYRPTATRARRFWVLAWVMLVLMTLWGAGGQPLWVWLYSALPPLQGWRFVGRALAVGGFFLAALVALRVDALWRSIQTVDWTRALAPPAPDAGAVRRLTARALPPALAAALLIGSGWAGWNVAAYWNIHNENILNPIHPDDVCVGWLRARFPDAHLSVWRANYEAVTTYLNHRVRAAQIYADFEMMPRPSTIGRLDLTLALPEYAIAWKNYERVFLIDNRYRQIPDSPTLTQTGDVPCLYHKADALTYAYTAAYDVIRSAAPLEDYFMPPPNFEPLPPDATIPVEPLLRLPDALVLAARSLPGQQTVLTAQERAYPGWAAWLNGEPHPLESVGGQVGVILPLDNQTHIVTFMYRPPLLLAGALVTLLAALLSALALLRADRLIRRGRRL